MHGITNFKYIVVFDWNKKQFCCSFKILPVQINNKNWFSIVLSLLLWNSFCNRNTFIKLQMNNHKERIVYQYARKSEVTHFLMCAQFLQYRRLTQLFISSELSNFSFPRYAQIFSSSSYPLRSNRRILSSGDHVRVWRNVGDQIVCQIFIQYVIAVPYKHLSTKRESYNNQLISVQKICQIFHRHTRFNLFPSSCNRHKSLHLFVQNELQIYFPLYWKEFFSKILLYHTALYISTLLLKLLKVLPFSKTPLLRTQIWDYTLKNIILLLYPSHLRSQKH
jgi:hypothetical protein